MAEVFAHVQILARCTAKGVAIGKLANVLAIGQRQLIIEIDDPPGDDVLMFVSFVVPGSHERVILEGILGAPADDQGLTRYFAIRHSPPELLEFVYKRISAEADKDPQP